MEREKEVQTHATIRAEQRSKEQSELIFDQQRNAARLAKEVRGSVDSRILSIHSMILFVAFLVKDFVSLRNTVILFESLSDTHTHSRTLTLYDSVTVSFYHSQTLSHSLTISLSLSLSITPTPRSSTSRKN